MGEKRSCMCGKSCVGRRECGLSRMLSCTG